MSRLPFRGASGRALLKQLVSYLAVGGSAFLIDFGLLALLKSGFGWAASLAAAVAFLSSTVFSYAMQRMVTFKSNSAHAKSVFRYALLLGFNTAVTSGIVELFDLYAHMYLFGKVVSTGLTTLWNFPLMRYWVYKSEQKSSVDDVADEQEAAESQVAEQSQAIEQDQAVEQGQVSAQGAPNQVQPTQQVQTAQQVPPQPNAAPVKSHASGSVGKTAGPVNV